MGLRQSKPSTAESELSADKRYQYSPLSDTDDIRLLRIKRGRKNDKIKCTLFPVSFASKPTYKALSYTWGTDSKTHTIECDGKILPITANLHSALRRFREKKRVCTIWVDAICINQDDTPERNKQVQNMRQVYSFASEVVIWLGDEIETDEESFGFINSFDRNLNTHPEIDWDDPSSYLRLPGIETTFWKSLTTTLIQRPWFGRIWVIQEVAMASNAKLFCGSHTCTWESISRMINYIRTTPAVTIFGSKTSVANTVSIMATFKAHVVEKGFVDMTFLELLNATQPFLSTDPRDRFFALLGFLPSNNTTGIRLDYSLSCEQVYRDWAVQSIIDEGSLAILSSAERGQSSGLNLPSWIPDWSCAPEQTARNSLLDLGFEAAGESTVEVFLSENGEVLEVMGFAVDIIQRVGSFVVGGYDRIVQGWEDFAETMRYENEVFGECEDIASVAQPYPTGEDFIDAYAKSLICNQMFITGDSQNPQEGSKDTFFSRGYHCFRRMHEELVKCPLEEFTRVRAELVSTLDTEVLLQYTSLINIVTIGRKFCATEKRYLGLVPGGAEPGDIICIFLGAEVPYILRPDENDSKYYKLIGECYIHGIMQGEALKWDGVSQQGFKIR